MSLFSKILALIGGIAIGFAAPIAESAAASGDDVPVSWQHHQARFDYFGFTVAYSCDGLETQVGRILTYLGARDGVKVRGHCPRGSDSLTNQAWVDVEFDVPVEATEVAAEKGQWVDVVLDARHPNFMSRGDCDIMHSLKELILANFGLRNPIYTASCTPHQLSDQDFSLKGQALKMAPRAR